MGDKVVCKWCNWDGVVRTGCTRCPNCKGEHCLDWLNGVQEVEEAPTIQPDCHKCSDTECSYHPEYIPESEDNQT